MVESASKRVELEDLQKPERIQNYSVDEISDSVEYSLFEKSTCKGNPHSVFAFNHTRADSELFQPYGQLQISGEIMMIESERKSQLADLEGKRHLMGEEAVREMKVKIEQDFQKRLGDLDQTAEH